MSKFTITSLNYASSGFRRGLINLDMSVDYSYVEQNAIITENSVSGIALDESSYRISALATDQLPYETPTLDLIYRNMTFVIDKDAMGTSFGYKNILRRNDCSVFPIYDITDVCMKSPIKKNFAKNYILPETDMFMDIYQCDMERQPIAFCCYGDRSIVLTEPSEKDFVYVKTSLRNNRNDPPGFYYTTYLDNAQTSETYTYVTPSELSTGLTSYQQYLSTFQGDFTDKSIYNTYISAIYKIFEPKYIHSGIEYNYVINFEQSDIKLDYDSGNMYGLATKAKCVLDQLYSQSMKADGELNKCRQYLGITGTGSDVYLKFTNNIRYPIRVQISSNISCNILHDKVIDTKKVPYQKLEQYTPTRIGSTTRHKSNLFSIRIKNTTLGSQTLTPVVQSVRKDITNAVKDIVSMISPVNTQLFDVQFED